MKSTRTLNFCSYYSAASLPVLLILFLGQARTTEAFLIKCIAGGFVSVLTPMKSPLADGGTRTFYYSKQGNYFEIYSISG